MAPPTGVRSLPLICKWGMEMLVGSRQGEGRHRMLCLDQVPSLWHKREALLVANSYPSSQLKNRKYDRKYIFDPLSEKEEIWLLTRSVTIHQAHKKKVILDFCIQYRSSTKETWWNRYKLFSSGGVQIQFLHLLKKHKPTQLMWAETFVGQEGQSWLAVKLDSQTLRVIPAHNPGNILSPGGD